MTAPYHPALTITVREDNSKPFPTIPGIDHLKCFLKSKLKPKSEKHAAGSRSKTEPADDYDDYSYSDNADGQDYASEYTDTYYTDEDYGYVPDGSGAYDSAPAQSTWQYDDGGYDEPQAEEEPGIHCSRHRTLRCARCDGAGGAKIYRADAGGL